MGYLDIEALRTASVSHEPFDYLVLEGFVREDARP